MNEICHRCKRPVLDDELRYTAGEPKRYEHYECYEIWSNQLKADLAAAPAKIDKAFALLDKLRRTLK